MTDACAAVVASEDDLAAFAFGDVEHGLHGFEECRSDGGLRVALACGTYSVAGYLARLGSEVCGERSGKILVTSGTNSETLSLIAGTTYFVRSVICFGM